MKVKEKQESIKLRKIGKSMGDISQILNVSKSTVSRWVRGVDVSDEIINNKILIAAKRRGNVISERYRNKRKEYQNEGRSIAICGSELFRQGCLLYWAEGAKSRTCLDFSNSDSEMIKFFVKFLKEECKVSKNDITFSVMAHLNNGLSEKDINDYWMDLIGVPEENVRKFQLKTKYYDDNNSKSNRICYGVCKLKVKRSVRLIQQIFGAIQEIVGIEGYKYVD